MTKITRFEDIPKRIGFGNYRANIGWDGIDRMLKSLSDGEYGLDLHPDFQRGHVWTEEQQSSYVEFKLSWGSGSDLLLFNDPYWMNVKAHDVQSDMKYKKCVLVDGLQRLTAVQRFMGNEIKAYGSYFSEYTDYVRDLRVGFVYHVNELSTDKDILRWYLELNGGGTPHTEEELDRVRKMMEKS